jgi:K(+)-stimulated pyrophosphate-energized sodium pump
MLLVFHLQARSRERHKLPQFNIYNMHIVTYFLPLLGILALVYTALQAAWIVKQNPGEAKMVAIAHSIARGAVAFLRAEYRTISYFVGVAALFLFYLSVTSGHTHPLIVVAFVIGALFSALAGWVGMRIATQANVRTAQAARTSLAKAFKISFAGGTVMGMGVTGLAMVGLGGLFILFFSYFLPEGLTNANRPALALALETLTGFSLGAESIALFARVAGGIYTKAADVGADIVGKVETDIPEDDPRNPATIADNVGDNVGDVAGMGADLFGSYVATILAAMVLGSEIEAPDKLGGLSALLLPMLIGASGIVFSLVATFFVSIKETGDVQQALNKGNWIATLLTGLLAYLIIPQLLPATFSMRGQAFVAMGVFYAVVTGLVVGVLISMITEYFTAIDQKPVRFIVKQSYTGHATNIIAGLSVGMFSTALPMILFAAGVYSSFYFAGFYGIAMAAAGMMATTAIQLSIDAFGPIADNAGGIAEMCGLPQEVRQRTDTLDAVGNTTAATGKGFAIASAALTSLALFAAYARTANIQTIDIYRAPVMAGLFVGGMIPFLFSALTISAVGSAAMAMVREVRRQFREIKGILQGEAQPEYDKCIDIATKAALNAMLLPGALAVIMPIIVGFAFGPEVLGGFLAGLTVSGVLMALFQANAGGAWDNAKKSFERGVEINGEMFYKGSEAHKASVTGDTVGDPFKDTSGPSMNILIKLSSIIALVIAPHIALKACNTLAKSKTVPLQINDSAPAFVGKDQDNQIIRLTDFAGKKLVLYFYPKDNTPFCTAQARSLRDHYESLQQAGYEVVGVSTDSAASHKRFIEKNKLPFRLITDKDHTIHEKYGTWVRKSMFVFWKYWGTARTTFVISEDGKIEQIIGTVAAGSHAAQILNRRSGGMIRSQNEKDLMTPNLQESLHSDERSHPSTE